MKPLSMEAKLFINAVENATEAHVTLLDEGILVRSPDGRIPNLGNTILCIIANIEKQKEYEKLSDDELDELVIDQKCEEASEINNQGREAQIKYLTEGWRD
jgi:hypothetical protein